MAPVRTRHAVYTGITARGAVLLKCLCGFEVEAPTELDAREAHSQSIGKNNAA